MSKRGPCGEIPHLKGQRYLLNELSSKLHDTSRHCEFGEATIQHSQLPPKFEVAQGSRFPPYVKPGDISQIRNT